MLKDITIGQYYPTDSFIHKLDPRVKLGTTILFIISLFFVKSFVGYLYIILSLLVAIGISKVPLKFMLKGLKSIFAIILFTVFLNIFFTPGETIIFHFKFITITMEGIIIAVKMAMRFVLLIIGSSLLTLTTSPVQLTDAIEYMLKPFKKIGVPAHEIAMMMTIALRFIPTLLEELDKIMKAQTARGADFDTGGLLKKAKSLIPLLVPLFISSFRRAEELAMAMEARCYNGDNNRTRMKKLELESSDYLAMLVVTVYLLGIAFLYMF